MELYIVFYQSNKADGLYSVCNSLEEAKKRFNDFIAIEQKERSTGTECDESMRTDSLFEITGGKGYHAVIAYSKIPFNVFFSLEELIK